MAHSTWKTNGRGSWVSGTWLTTLKAALLKDKQYLHFLISGTGHSLQKYSHDAKESVSEQKRNASSWLFSISVNSGWCIFVLIL